MYGRMFASLLSIVMLSMVFLLSSCQGKGQGSKSSAKDSKHAVKASVKKDTLESYKTAGKFDSAKLFTDMNAAPIVHKMPAGLKGSAAKGKKIFSNVKTGNCAACHCTEDAVGCGNIGRSLVKYRSGLGAKLAPGKKKKTDEWLYTVIADRRNFNKATVMPPFLPTKVLVKQDIVDLVAYLNSLK